MNKILSVAAVALLAFAPSAHASILDITLGTPGSTTVAGSLVGNVNASTALGSSLFLINNAALISPPSSIYGQYSAPHDGVGLYGNSYVSVLGASGATPAGEALFVLPSGDNTFAFTWGTIDAFNTLVLKDATHTFTFTGQDILNIIGGPAGKVEADVSFYDPFGTIVTAELTSSANSFEGADFTETPAAGNIVYVCHGLSRLCVSGAAENR